MYILKSQLITVELCSWNYRGAFFDWLNLLVEGCNTNFRRTAEDLDLLTTVLFIQLFLQIYLSYKLMIFKY